MIVLRSLTVGYGKRQLITDANATIAAGRLVALIGRNGAGKSSLLRILGGLDRPLSGQVDVDGADVQTMSVGTRARRIAFVTTERTRIPNLQCRTVVGMGRAPYTDWVGRLSARDEQIVDRALADVNMSDYATRTMDKMSDGECQRIMIARALAQDTPVILLDEPTSFLDLPNRYELCLLLRQLAHEKGKCVVFSTHELDIALALCDDIALIDTPHLRYGPAEVVAKSGDVQRLFSNGNIIFDSETRQIRIDKQK